MTAITSVAGRIEILPLLHLTELWRSNFDNSLQIIHVEYGQHALLMVSTKHRKYLLKNLFNNATPFH